MSRRPLAFVDVETTGLDHQRHELLELAVILVDPDSLWPVEEYQSLVRPTRIEEADPEALAINGYTPEAWADAPIARHALAGAAPLLREATMAGHGVSFDHRFLISAFYTSGLRPFRIGDHHLLDTASLAWPLGLDSLSLDSVCAALGIERPRPHRALADARCSLEVARRLRARFGRKG